MITKADVVIIGAGIFGVSAAFYLARDTNLEVALIEKSQPGAGASGRSASIVRHNYSTDIMIKSAIESQRIFKNFESEVGEPIEFVTNSYLGVVSTMKHDALRGIVERVKTFGINAKLLSPEEIREQHPYVNTDEITAAIHNLDAGYVYDPQIPISVYVKQAEKHGAKAYNDTKVTGIRTRDGAVKSVVTNKGEIETDYVLNVTGPWAREVGRMVGLDIPVESQRQQLVEILPSPEWPLTRPTFSDHEQLTYIRPMKGGIAHCGGHYFGAECDPDNYNEGVDQEFTTDVLNRLTLKVPSLKDAKIVRGYSGLYENTPDTYPIVGESEEVKRFINCVGWSGHGYKHGPMFGILLKELIQTGKTSLDISQLSLERFKTGQLVKTAYGVNAPYG